MDWAIGVDIGGTKCNIGAVDLQGNILSKKKIATNPERDPDLIIKEISVVIKEIIAKIDSAPLGIGVGMAGQIDEETGMVLFAPNLKWHNIPLKEKLASILGLPVVVANDVRAISYGEWFLGAGQGCNNFVCMFIGTGIGSGIVINGAMLSGSNNVAGEVGHMIVEMNGPACTCGNWGCMEAYAGGWGIARQAEKDLLIKPEDGQILQKIIDENDGEITAKLVIDAYRKDDPIAIKVIQNAIQAVIAGSVSIVNALNPERLIFGGGIIDGLPEIIQEVNLGVRQRALPAASEHLHIVMAKLDKDAGLIGSAIFAQQTFKKL